jgi:hypothetical protein
VTLLSQQLLLFECCTQSICLAGQWLARQMQSFQKDLTSAAVLFKPFRTVSTAAFLIDAIIPV